MNDASRAGTVSRTSAGNDATSGATATIRPFRISTQM